MVGYQRTKAKAMPMWQTSKKRSRAPSSHVLNFTSNLGDPSDHRRKLKHDERHIQDWEHDRGEGINSQKEQ